MRGVIYTIIAVLLCALQTTIFEIIKIVGVRPNLLLAFIVCIALLRGSFEGGAVGLLCGILADITGYGVFGVNSIMFLYTGILIGFFSSKFYRVRNIVAVSFCFAANFTYGFLYYFFAYYIWGNGGMMHAISIKIFPESIYTALISMLILLLIGTINSHLIIKEA